MSFNRNNRFKSSKKKKFVTTSSRLRGTNNKNKSNDEISNKISKCLGYIRKHVNEISELNIDSDPHVLNIPGHSRFHIYDPGFLKVYVKKGDDYCKLEDNEFWNICGMWFRLMNDDDIFNDVDSDSLPINIREYLLSKKSVSKDCLIDKSLDLLFPEALKEFIPYLGFDAKYTCMVGKWSETDRLVGYCSPALLHGMVNEEALFHDSILAAYRLFGDYSFYHQLFVSKCFLPYDYDLRDDERFILLFEETVSLHYDLIGTCNLEEVDKDDNVVTDSFRPSIYWLIYNKYYGLNVIKPDLKIFLIVGYCLKNSLFGFEELANYLRINLILFLSIFDKHHGEWVKDFLFTKDESGSIPNEYYWLLKSCLSGLAGPIDKFNNPYWHRRLNTTFISDILNVSKNEAVRNDRNDLFSFFITAITTLKYFDKFSDELEFQIMKIFGREQFFRISGGGAIRNSMKKIINPSRRLKVCKLINNFKVYELKCFDFIKNDVPFELGIEGVSLDFGLMKMDAIHNKSRYRYMEKVFDPCAKKGDISVVVNYTNTLVCNFKNGSMQYRLQDILWFSRNDEEEEFKYTLLNSEYSMGGHYNHEYVNVSDLVKIGIDDVMVSHYSCDPKDVDEVCRRMDSVFLKTD